jgi:hypothetical protein
VVAGSGYSLVGGRRLDWAPCGQLLDTAPLRAHLVGGGERFALMVCQTGIQSLIDRTDRRGR